PAVSRTARSPARPFWRPLPATRPSASPTRPAISTSPYASSPPSATAPSKPWARSTHRPHPHPPRSSLPPKLRLPLLHEGAHPFLLIGGSEEHRESLRFELVRRHEVRIDAAEHDALRLGNRERPLLRDLLGGRERLRHEL